MERVSRDIVKSIERQLLQAGSQGDGVRFEGVCVVICPCHSVFAISVDRLQHVPVSK